MYKKTSEIALAVEIAEEYLKDFHKNKSSEVHQRVCLGMAADALKFAHSFSYGASCLAPGWVASEIINRKSKVIKASMRLPKI